jgi:putative ABC transport system permease protein
LFVDLGNKKYKFAHGQSVSGDYFQAIGIPILEGRSFSEIDSKNHANVIVISKGMARAFWPGEDPLGKPVRLEESGPEKPPREIIGIVGDVKFNGLGEETSPVYYLPADRGSLTLVVRTASDPRAFVKTIRESFRKIAPNIPLFNVRTMNEVVADSTSAPRFRGIVVGIFAALALILAVFGLYSVVSYSVTSRTHEMGVRMALGAQPRNILVMVTREGMWLALAGISVGLLGSFWVTKFIATLLYGVKPTDSATLITAAAVLVGCTVLACALPARRASRTDPASALRFE